MLGLKWANNLASAPVKTGPRALLVASALMTGACAAGDGGISASENPFTSPGSQGGSSPTDGTGASTGGTGSAGATESPTDGSASNSNSNTNPMPATAEAGETTIDPDPTGNPDPDCMDMDQDGYGVDCQLGSDCDDNDYNNHTPEGCANCKDGDGDDFWVGCDQYGDDKPGPDCDDGNPDVGGMDAEELCNGKAENCAGEIDPLPADEMCPTNGEGEHVAGVGGWMCNPVTPGEDGCEIAACDDGYFDADKNPDNGCECVGTDRTKSLDSCGDGMAGFKGMIAEGAVVNMVSGVIPFVDNGPGAGLEDWYSVSFPEGMANGVRPNAGNISVAFSANPGDPANPDYRIEVYRACNGAPFDMSLATQFGPGAPPAREWSFFDNHPNPGNPMYKNDVAWPEKVYIRVIRVNNSGQCGQYSLQLARTAN
jgi:hypothetical protein